MESRETLFQTLQLVLVLAALLFAGEPVFFLSCVTLSFILYFGKKHRERYHYLPKLWHESFDVDDFARGLHAQLATPEKEAVSVPGQNIVVYSGFNPFVGSGTNLGGWSFAVDVTRPIADRGSAPPVTFELPEFLDEIDGAIKRLDLRNTEVQDTLFVNGSNIPEGSVIQPDRFMRPLQHTDATTVREFTRLNSRSIRTYKWIRFHDWDSDLILSFFLRATMNGKTLFVEFSRYVLAPLGDKYRGIDRIARSGFSAAREFLIKTVIMWPLAVILGFLSLWWKFTLAIRSAFDTERREKRREIEANPLYDYGTKSSLRETIAGGQYLHYFQRMDKELGEKAVEKQVLDTIVDFLGARGIDTSDLRERQITILNQGIVMQGGDVKAQSLAVGVGAKATNVLQRVRPRS